MSASGSGPGSASHRRDDASGRRRTTGSQPIAGYHLLQRIGRGSMGIVYRAIQLSMQREVALKVLDPKLAEAPGFTTRFIHEARAAGAVNHPHVITCYDAGTSGELVYQALELLLGGDLDQHCRAHGGRLDEKQAMAIALDCAQGLEGIHAAGLTHRDVKPSNIFIADEGVAKLGDLGLARSLGADETGSTRVARSGDAAFTAPEQLAGGPCDIRADIYSLGATLYWMVCGVKPFVPRSDEE
ncbi:MAG: serine/threonine protein kinase, partial [Planctomycetes bacterium]|nr:serine/threonine protein kinase [Planctomycetota bacterium]